jgi:hypothetical protein
LTLDISKHQNGGRGFPVATFEGFRDAGVGRVIVKLGGSNNTDYPQYTETVHHDNARSADLIVDSYWANGQAGTPQEVAEAIVRTGQVRGDEVLWWDVETWPNEANAWTPTEVVAYAKALEAAGIPLSRQGVYLSSGMTKGSSNWSPVVALGLPLWVADYGLNNGQVSSKPLVGYWKDVALFQYTSTGKLPGYDGNLDLSITGADVWTVYDLQVALNKVMNAGLVEDGEDGSNTRKGVRNFQTKYNLDSDGIAGRDTLTKLEEVLGG